MKNKITTFGFNLATNLLLEPNLDFQPIFKNTGTLTYQISKEVIKSNQDMIENARLELIHMVFCFFAFVSPFINSYFYSLKKEIVP